MMNTLFLSNWIHESVSSRALSSHRRALLGAEDMAGVDLQGPFQRADEMRVRNDALNGKKRELTRAGAPQYKRRRIRGGHVQAQAARLPKEMEM